MVIHALGSDMDYYLRGEEPVVIKETVVKYMPYIIIAGAVILAVIVMAGTGGRRS